MANKKIICFVGFVGFVLLLSINVLAAEKEEANTGKDYVFGLILRKSFIDLNQFSGELVKEGLEEFSDNPNLIGVFFSPSRESIVRVYGYSGTEIKGKADKSGNASFKIEYSGISVIPLDKISYKRFLCEYGFGFGFGYGETEFEVKKVTNDVNYPWQYRKITNSFFVFEPQASFNIAYAKKPFYLIPNELEFAISYFIPFAVRVNSEGDFTSLSRYKMDLKHFAAQINFVWREF